MRVLHTFFTKNKKAFIMFSFSLTIISIFYSSFPPIENMSYLKWLFLPIFIFVLLFNFKVNLLKKHKSNILTFFVIFGLMLLARILFLINTEGIFDSDDAIVSIMTQHLLEGNPISFFYYGQRYLGSGCSLFNTIFVLIMGYKPLTFAVSSLFFVSMAIFIQFKLTKKYFNNIYSYFVLVFYLFSSGLYSRSIINIGTYYPWVFLFLSLILYLTLEIFVEKKDYLIPYLGFVIAISYWVHQINMLFGVVPILLILFNKKIKDKIVLFIYGVIGSLPLLFFEFTHSFVNTRFILNGKAMPVPITIRVQNFLRGIKELFPSPLLTFFVYAFAICFICLFFFSIKQIFKKGFTNRDTLILLFTLSYIVLYLLSSFSYQYIFRYFVPLYIVIPLIFITLGIYMGDKLGKIIMILFFSVLLVCSFVDNLKLSANYGEVAKKRKLFVKDLQGTGSNYFFCMPYFESYIYDMLSQGKIHVVNGFLERYLPNKLAMYNQYEFAFYTHFREADKIENNFKHYGINYKIIKKNFYAIFYDIKTRINYWDIFQDMIEDIGSVKLENVQKNKIIFIKSGNLSGNFKLNFVLHSLNMPSFKSKVRLSGNKYSVTIPDIYSGKEVKVEAFLEFRGTVIPKTRIFYPLILDKWNDSNQKIFYLQGFSDSHNGIEGFTHGRGLSWKQKVKLHQGKLMEKKSLIYIRSKGLKSVALFIENIIDFKRNIWWRTDIKQTIKVEFGGGVQEYVLEEGENKIDLDLSKLNSDNVILKMESKYHLPYIFNGFGYVVAGTNLRRLELN